VLLLSLSLCYLDYNFFEHKVRGGTQLHLSTTYMLYAGVQVV
jgi:hypothetical protein